MILTTIILLRLNSVDHVCSNSLILHNRGIIFFVLNVAILGSQLEFINWNSEQLTNLLSQESNGLVSGHNSALKHIIGLQNDSNDSLMGTSSVIRSLGIVSSLAFELVKESHENRNGF